jgi:large subunit ribosomal protein L4
MATLPIFNLGGEEVDTIEVSDRVFAGEVRRHLFYEVVKWQRAKRRAGTHATKGRNEVSGGGAKPYRQKGTGRARQGSRRAPNHVGGGTVHGPTPRSYAYRINKKLKAAALRSALSLRAQAGDMIVVQNLELGEVKTRKAKVVIERLAGQKALVVDGPNNDLQLSVRNLQGILYLRADGINVYDILKYPKLVLTEPVVRRLEGILG